MMVTCRPNCTCLPSFMRIRFVVAATSFIGFIVFLVVMLLRSPPSVLLPNRPPAGRKVSVIVVPSPSPNMTQLVHFCLGAATVLSFEHLESEFLVISDAKLKPSLSLLVDSLHDKGHHVELLHRRAQDNFSNTLTSAFANTHFSLILVLADMRVSVEKVVPSLVMPVLSSHTDMTLALYKDKSYFLGLLSYPLTLSMAGGGNSTTFCLHKALWMKGCEGVSPSARSLSLELLSKCNLHNHLTLTLPVSTLQPSSSSSLDLFKQVLGLYWELHPGWCVTVAILLLISCVYCTCTRIIAGSNSFTQTSISTVHHTV